MSTTPAKTDKVDSTTQEPPYPVYTPPKVEPIKMDIKYDTPETCKTKINHLRECLKLRKTTSIPYRKQQLKKLLELIEKYKDEINASNYLDLGQSEFISMYTTFIQLKNLIKDTLNNLDSWAKPRKVDTPATFGFSSAYVQPEPFGIVLIFSAWNCNFLTLLVPLAQAIAAGNLVLCKPAATSVETCKVCMKILNEMDKEVVECCAGDQKVREELLKNQFDLIMFTGSSKVGKIIAGKAAQNLTPTILELGGQNPVIVDNSADLKLAAYNIISGRMTMNGQACIAPEYILCDNQIYDKLKEELKKTFKIFLGEDPLKSEYVGRIINKNHCQRIAEIIKNPGSGAELIYGDIKKIDIENRIILPYLFSFKNLDDCNKSELAKEEIFGPVLYMAPYEKLEDALIYLNQRPKPLAAYAFTTNKKNKKFLIENFSSGNFVFNDTVMHFTSQFLPFGGVGKSGMGYYHGKWGFDSFSHLKGILDASTKMIQSRYPPFDQKKKDFLLKALNRFSFGTWGVIGKVVHIIMLAIAVYCIVDIIRMYVDENYA